MSAVATVDPACWIRLSPLVAGERAALEELASRLRARDVALIERVLRELVPLVRRIVHRMLGPHRERDDALQDALAEIASALHRFEGRSSLSTLAQRIAVRTTARHFRRPRRELGDADLDTIPADEDETSPERSASERQRVARLYHHLDALSEARRTAFVLCALQEMTPTEAAEIAMCTPVAMRSRLFEARRELEARIARDPVLTGGQGASR